jgi:hypothetical protein
VACPELFNAATPRLVDPSRNVTDPPVTLTPADFTVAVSVSEAPVLVDELDNDSEVALALGCVLDVPPPPLEQPARTPTATSRNAAESVE